VEGLNQTSSHHTIENTNPNFSNFNANDVYKWNIDEKA